MKKKIILVLVFFCIIIGLAFGSYYLWSKKNKSEIDVKYELSDNTISKLNGFFEDQFAMQPLVITNSKDGNNMLNLYVIDIINELNIVIPALTNEKYQKSSNLEFFNANEGLNGSAYAYSNACKLSSYIKKMSLKKQALEFEKINNKIDQILTPYTNSGLSKLSLDKKKEIQNELKIEEKKLLILYSQMNKGNLNRAQQWKEKNMELNSEMDKVPAM